MRRKKGTQRGKIGVVIPFKLVDDPVCPERILRACRQQTRLQVSAYFSSFYFHIYLSFLRFDSYFIARYFVHTVKIHIVGFGLRIIKYALSILGLRIIK